MMGEKSLRVFPSEYRQRQSLPSKFSLVVSYHVIEPKLGDGGEVIACIPIRVSAEAEFAK